MFSYKFLKKTFSNTNGKTDSTNRKALRNLFENKYGVWRWPALDRGNRRAVLWEEQCARSRRWQGLSATWEQYCHQKTYSDPFSKHSSYLKGIRRVLPQIRWEVLWFSQNTWRNRSWYCPHLWQQPRYLRGADQSNNLLTQGCQLGDGGFTGSHQGCNWGAA